MKENPANESESPSQRASRTRDALFVVVLLGLATMAVSCALAGDPTPTGPQRAVFPLPQRYENSYRDDWGESRVQGKHEGTDVFAPQGTKIRSITSGTVVRPRGTDDRDWNSLGGYTVMVKAAYDAGPIRRGDLLYYAHMKARSTLIPGDTVESGEKLGEVGSTGQGPEGTKGRFQPHLHLGWYEGGWLGDERPASPSGAMNPYPLLRWLEADAQASRSEHQSVTRKVHGPL